MKLLRSKKYLLILICLSFILFEIVIREASYFLKAPETTLLVNNLSEHQLSLANMLLYYSTPTHSSIRTYTLSHNHLSRGSVKSASYTEGFLPFKVRQALLDLINTQTNPSVPLHYFYNYAEDTHYKIVAPTGPLSHVYFIDSTTNKVHTPDTYGIPAQDFYLNHITRKGNVYYLLGDIVGEYKSLLYTLDATTLKVLQQVQFDTSSFAIYKQHSSLNTLGHAFFVMQSGVGHLQPSQLVPNFINLGFTPSYLISNGLNTVAFTLQTGVLNCAQLDGVGNLLMSYKLPLPETYLVPVKAYLQGQFLTLLTFSPNHPIYTNYVLIYDLTTKQLLYCCALQGLSPYIALDFSLLNDSAIF